MPEMSAVTPIEYLHVAVWLVVVLGGAVSPRLAKLNLFVFLPLIYVLHVLPFHAILKPKLQYIAAHPEAFPPPTASPTPAEVAAYAGQFDAGVPEAVRARAVAVMKDSERGNPVVSCFLGMRDAFSHSFANPLSAQGMVILGFVLNIAALKLRWKTCV
jgi:hypothetical protein